MPIQFHTYNRTFYLASGNAELTINYGTDEYQSATLDFEVINIAELSYGFEDDDQLTFYPNVLTITCDDYNTYNFNVLKYATQLRPPLTKPGEIYLHNNWPETNTKDLDKYYGVELKLNGRLLFKGYIDRNKIEYNYKTGELTFDCIDYTALLHQVNYKLDYYQNKDPANWYSPIDYVASVFRLIYPDLPDLTAPSNMPITNNANYFANTMDLGFYFRHNWLFKCGNPPPYIRSWNLDIDPTGWYYVAFYMPTIKSQSNNLAQDIRQLAHELGCVIGSDVYNKIWFYKRFMTLAELQASNPHLLTNDVVINYDRYMHLPQLRAVRNITKRSRLIHIIGEGNYPKVAPEPDSQAAYSQYQLDIQTSLEPALGGGGTSGRSTFRDKQNIEGGHISNGIIDPSLPSDDAYDAYKIIANWYYYSRNRNRDRIELELWGVDYWMHIIYLYWFNNHHYAYMRPMTIKKDLVNNKTAMTGIEILI
jgi:hypothetical protein